MTRLRDRRSALLSTDHRLTVRNYAFAAICVVALWVFARNVLEYVACDYWADDAFISLRYSQRLLAGDGLTWSDGERVEGFSNLLWVLCVSGLGALGLDLLVAVRVLAFAGMGLAFACLAWMVRPARMGHSVLPGAFTLFALAQCQPIVIWTAGGLETPFVLGFMAGGMLCVVRWMEADGGSGRVLAPAGVPLGLLTLTRPEGPLFTVLCAVAVLVVSVRDDSRGTLRRLGRLCALPLAAFSAQEVFRLLYYGRLLPNTALVKLPGGLFRVHEGLEYVVSGLQHQWPLWLPALASLPLAACRERGSGRHVRFLWTVAAVWTAYVVYAGGDHLAGRRFLTPTLFLACWLGGEGVALVRQTLGPCRPYATAALAVAVFGILSWFPLIQWQDQAVNTSRYDVWQPRRRGAWIAWFLHHAIPLDRPLLVAVDAAGSIPYHMPDDQFLDMLGLTDPWLALHSTARQETGRLAHSLGNAEYFLERRPDVFLFGPLFGCRRGVYQSQQELTEDVRFLDAYRFHEVTWSGQPRVRMWVRQDLPLSLTDPGVTP